MLTVKQQGHLLKAMFLLFLLQLGLKINIFDNSQTAPMKFVPDIKGC